MATPTPAPTSPASTAAALASGRHGGFLVGRARVAPGGRSALRAQPAAAELVERSVNTIRFLAVDAVEKAKSGHPGLPMGCAPLGHVLFDEFLRFNPANHAWFDRDRFVLSAGHGCMLQYALLHLAGYQGVTIDDLKAFRQWGSRTPGHPENFETDGVEVTTGMLYLGMVVKWKVLRMRPPPLLATGVSES